MKTISISNRMISVMLMLTLMSLLSCEIADKKNDEASQSSLLTLIGIVSQTNQAQTPDTYQSVGGTLTGQLNGGTLVLQLNGANNLSRNALGNFLFSTNIKSNSSYSVSVLSNPNGVTCGITNKASGTIGTSNITDVTADCNICGNGVKVSYEACDDGNLANGDGCNNTCRIEAGFSCNNTSPSVCVNI
ncbi:myxococcus cysteine-rich repeat containing protein [Leptospira vanthielii]|uniref:DUF4215 domain-containing protein n=1 Tax=Leptospira vanthielii TaxID=293085 RepID=A0ABY2NQR0_9LEPT|nr:myxococcus cysteine-rich repeat containing protein [Leptospira vanthielii]TGM59014.1 DUF4215 domain-containing protein [Leptospira vanthielii]